MEIVILQNTRKNNQVLLVLESEQKREFQHRNNVSRTSMYSKNLAEKPMKAFH